MHNIHHIFVRQEANYIMLEIIDNDNDAKLFTYTNNSVIAPIDSSDDPTPELITVLIEVLEIVPRVSPQLTATHIVYFPDRRVEQVYCRRLA